MHFVFLNHQIALTILLIVDQVDLLSRAYYTSPFLITFKRE